MSNNKYKILLVEDDRNIKALVTTILESADYQIVGADTCSLAKVLYASHRPDLILLDLGLPDEDGICLLKAIREHAHTPVIVLSARSDEKDIVEALDLGANDYVRKPFGTAELLARVRSALRNSRSSSGQGQEARGRCTLGDLVIDYDSRQVFIGGDEIRLTQTEYNIVALLAKNSGKMMTYTAIIKEIWGYPDSGGVKKLQVNVANIRRKLAAGAGDFSYIANELGVGYRMDARRR